MKLFKYYSLDECSEQDKILEKLDKLSDDRKIDYEFVEADLIKVKDLSLTLKEVKELSQFLHDNDVIEDLDFEEDDDFDEDFDDYESEDDY
jgi:hypothetical protein